MTIRCPNCDRDVPAGEFCGRCGARLSGERQGGRSRRPWLRPRYYAAAPNLSVFVPAVASTLFPRLTRSSRRAFHIALAVTVVTLLTLAALRLIPVLIAVGALGIPLLFALYLRASGAFRDVPSRLLAVSAVLGACLGVAGMLAAGSLIAHFYDIPITTGMAWNKFLRHGLEIPLGAAALKVVPAVVGRVISRPPRKALDGFAIGALGALAYGAAATLTRLAPQFAEGSIASQRSFWGLIVEALISGVTVPLTAAASGGTIGLALWFAPDPAESAADRRRARLGLAVLSVAVLVLFVGVVATDAAGLDQMRALTLHLALAVGAGLVLRLALQIALLHEAHEPARDETVRCGFCSATVPMMSFCPSCGVAAAALPPDSVPATKLGPLLGRWAVGNAAVAVVLSVLSLVVTDRPPQYRCPPDCGRPPIGTPVTDLPRFTAADGSFSVSYPAADTSYEVTTQPNAVVARWKAGDGGFLWMYGEPAAGRPPRDIALALLKKKFPNFTLDYEIPNAMVGYQPGYGTTADRWPPSSGGKYLRLRVVLLVSVKNDVALVAAAVGPFRQFGPNSGPGLPSGANLQVAQDMGKYVNSFRWKGDPLD